MKTEQQYFKEAISLESYMNSMEKHKENSHQIYDAFKVPQEDGFIDLLQNTNPHILVITEDWCGDAMLNNPILRKVAEAASIDVRVVYRDQTLDLMDRYLTNGGRSIPVYLLMNQDGKVLTTWGPRAPELQKLVLEMKDSLPSTDDPSFAEKQQALFSQLTKDYVSNNHYWQLVYEDIRKRFSEALSNES
ncbi:thioredoxin family protein [Paenisporosarcina cavernae]|uniref:Thioredoxin family protein n=1 Tax=Paenisporosarcina cavernae TaxID=2320858 RepID=A0A385YTU1_9BACL|nr:thioredoxin family protein [Paenisporosarcina cavernae]AYC30295.1 thioredoxin family protein [Paenisporosarcina cavernae]